MQNVEIVHDEDYAKKYFELLELSPQAIFEVDSEGRILIANSKFGKLLGLNKTELIGRLLTDFADGTFVERIMNGPPHQDQWNGHIQFRSALKGSFYIEARCHRRSDRTTSRESILCFVEHLTEQKRLESLKDLIISSHSTGVWEHDLVSGDTFWSRGNYAIYNLSPDDPRSTRELWIKMMAREESLRIWELLKKCAASPGSRFETTFEANLLDGTHKHIAIRGESLANPQGGASTCIRGVSFDITALKEANLRLNLALETLKIGIWEYLPRQDKILWTPKQYEIFGTTPDQFDSSLAGFSKFIHTEDKHRVLEQTQNFMKTGTEYDLSFKINHAEKGVRYVRAKAFAERNQNNEVIRLVGLNWDVTEEILREEELEAQRMLALNQARLATIGEMSAGIAHEINNPLAIILGNAERLLESLHAFDRNEENQQYCRKIIETTDRIHKIVKSLRAISRNVTHEHEVPTEKVSLNQILDESLTLVGERLATFKIKLVKKGFDRKHIIECRPTEISQVFINLLNNSIDAIKDMKNPWIELDLFIKRDKIIIHFTDSGKGIAPEIANQIMSPFFSTKASHEGTGLGLSISESILKAHAGSINLDKFHPSTRFTIVLPLYQNESI